MESIYYCLEQGYSTGEQNIYSISYCYINIARAYDPYLLIMTCSYFAHTKQYLRYSRASQPWYLPKSALSHLDRAKKEDSPRLITLPSTHHSPITVNRNANVFTIGTVKLNSVSPR